MNASKWTSPLDCLRISHPPEGRCASIYPVVLWGAVWAAVLFSVIPAETDPEVSISWAELCDELLHDLLLSCGLNAQQLPTVPSTGHICLHEVQPTPELGEVGQLVAWFSFSCLAHSLTCIHTRRPDYKRPTAPQMGYLHAPLHISQIIKVFGDPQLQIRMQMKFCRRRVCCLPLASNKSAYGPNIQKSVRRSGHERTKDRSTFNSRVCVSALCFF